MAKWERGCIYSPRNNPHEFSIARSVTHFHSARIRETSLWEKDGRIKAEGERREKAMQTHGVSLVKQHAEQNERDRRKIESTKTRRAPSAFDKNYDGIILIPSAVVSDGTRRLRILRRQNKVTLEIRDERLKNGRILQALFAFFRSSRENRLGFAR